MIAALVAALATGPLAPSPAAPSPARPWPAQTARPLWSGSDGSVWVAPCAPETTDDPDPNACASLQVRDRTGARTVGHGYVWPGVGRIWSRRPGVAGPDVLVFGDFGGSSGCEELFAVQFTRGAARVQKLEPCHSPPLAAEVRGGRVVTDLTFPAGGTAVGGANATTAGVRVPAVWRDGAFRVDLAELAARSRGPDDLAVREAAVDASLEDARDKAGNASGDALRPAVQALFGLMLYGRADEARTMLHADWPSTLVSAQPYATRPVAGEAAFWRLLCEAAVRNPLWAEVGMDAIPHADLIRAGAVGG